MSDNGETTAIVTTKKPDAPAEWGERSEIGALAQRLQVMLPGNLDAEAALALAQYSKVMDANPFRGEIYAYRDKKGQIVLVDGYKLLARWARRQCNFADRYERLKEDEMPQGAAYGYRCYILRDDMKDMLKMFIEAGATWKEAFETAAQSAVGIVMKAELSSPPPKSWTWDQVAKKRAFKNAINFAFGAPSPREIAEESWRVGDTETSPEHWTAEPTASPEVAAQTAQYNARVEVIRESAINGDAQEAADELFDEGTSIETEPTDDDSPVSADVNADLEALEFTGPDNFHDVVMREIPHYKHARQIVNYLTGKLGQGWGQKFTKTELFDLLTEHAIEKGWQPES